MESRERFGATITQLFHGHILFAHDKFEWWNEVYVMPPMPMCERSFPVRERERKQIQSVCTMDHGSTGTQYR